jgi:multiple sugar transport system permease protein
VRSSLTSSRRRVRCLRTLMTYSLLLVGLLWFSYPLLWLVLGSLKPWVDFAKIPAPFLPSSLHPENYIAAWRTLPFGRFFANTFIIATINIAGTLLSSSLVAYGFARLRFWGRDVAFTVMLATMMLPGWVTLIPQFIIFRLMNWVNTWLPLTVPAFLGGAGNVFLMRQFFLTLPRELDEAARIDGCSELGIYWRVLMPLCKPVLATLAIFTFLGVWDALLIPLIYLHSQKLFTVSIGLAFMRHAITGEAGGGQALPIQALVLAACVFASVPPIAVFFFGQRHFVRGIALTGRTGI